MRAPARHLLLGACLVHPGERGEAGLKGSRTAAGMAGAGSTASPLTAMHRREPCLRATCGTDADCDDADVCNGLERCESGTCVLGTPLGCMPGNVVIVAPHQATPNPTHVTLSMVAELNAIDVYSLLDRSASMSTRRARRSSSPPRTPVRVMCLLLETSAVWYFAYGSNIQSAILRNRRGVSVLRAPRTGRRLAPHARQAPPLLGTGTLANIVRDPAAGVFGVIFEIRAEDLDRRVHVRGRYRGCRLACRTVECDIAVGERLSSPRS